MPVATFAFTSGTKMTVRPSLRPRATSSSRWVATVRLVPLSTGRRSTRLASPIDSPPRSTTVIVSPSMPYRVNPSTSATAGSRSANTFSVL